MVVGEAGAVVEAGMVGAYWGTASVVVAWGRDPRGGFRMAGWTVTPGLASIRVTEAVSTPTTALLILCLVLRSDDRARLASPGPWTRAVVRAGSGWRRVGRLGFTSVQPCADW